MLSGYLNNMSIEKKDRNGMAITLINNGMTIRKVARLFKKCHTVVIKINKKYNSLDKRHCALCGAIGEEMVDKDTVTICKKCKKEINRCL